MHFGFLAPNEFRIIWYSFRFTLNVADDGYTRNESCAIKLDIYVCFILSLCRYPCWWTISARG